MTGVLSILGMILKFLPYIVPILSGVFGALGRLNTAQGKEEAATIDLEELKSFVEEQTATAIYSMLEKHRHRLITTVPDEDQLARDKRLDELMLELERAQREYEKSSARDEQTLQP